MNAGYDATASVQALAVMMLPERARAQDSAPAFHSLGAGERQPRGVKRSAMFRVYFAFMNDFRGHKRLAATDAGKCIHMDLPDGVHQHRIQWAHRRACSHSSRWKWTILDRVGANVPPSPPLEDKINSELPDATREMFGQYRGSTVNLRDHDGFFVQIASKRRTMH